MILKFQQGGVYLPFVSYLSQESYLRPSLLIQQREESSKEDPIAKLLEKDIKALPNEYNQIIDTINNLYSIGMSTSDIESSYFSILKQIQTAKFNRDYYDKTYDVVKDKKALNEIAISLNGDLMCVNTKTGDYKFLSVDELLKSKDFRPLTNSELLYLRSDNPGLSFNNDILSIANNAVSMEDVNKMLLDVIQKLESTSESSEGYISTNAKTILRGIEDFKKAAEASNGEFNPTLNNLYKYKIIDENQSKQIQAAFNYLLLTLPENAKTLLKYKSIGVEGGIATILQQALTLHNKSKYEFSLDLEESLENSSGNSSGKSSKNIFKLDPISMLLAGFGLKQTITILTAKGGNTGLLVATIKMPITTKEGNSLGAGITLNDVTKSGYAGYLDFSLVSMGDAMIDFTGFDKVVLDGTALHVAYLPVDLLEYSTNGNIKPDINMLSRYNEVQKQIKEQNITDPNKINTLYQQANLPIMFTENGDVTTNYILFGIINGNAINTAFKTDAAMADWLSTVKDPNELDNTLSVINKGREKGNLILFDEDNWYDINGHNTMYKGTVFIPVNTDYFTSTAAMGNQPSLSEAITIEAKQQAELRENIANKIYHNPGNQL